MQLDAGNGGGCPPLQGEALGSWWARAAGSLGMSAPDLTDAINYTLTDSKSRFILNDLSPPDKHSEQAILALLGTRVSVIRRLYLPIVYPAIPSRELQPWESKPTTSEAHRLWVLPAQHTVFCPMCLISDDIPYFRRAWRLKVMVACPTHGQLTSDRCPHCQSPTATFKKQIGPHGLLLCQICGHSLISSKTRKKRAHYSETSERLARAVLLERIEVSRHSDPFKEVLNNYDFAGCFLDWAVYGDLHVYNHYTSIGRGMDNSVAWADMKLEDRAVCIQSYHNYLSTPVEERGCLLPPNAIFAFRTILSHWERMGVRFNAATSLLRTYSEQSKVRSNYKISFSVGIKGQFKRLVDIKSIIYSAWVANKTVDNQNHLGTYDNIYNAFEECNRDHSELCSHQIKATLFFHDVETNLWRAVCGDCHSVYFITVSKVSIKAPEFIPL